MFNCAFVFFPSGILCQAWYLIVSISDLCRLSNFVDSFKHSNVNAVLLNRLVKFVMKKKL